MATFAKIKMMSEDVNSLLLTGKFKANANYAEVEDGAFGAESQSQRHAKH